MTRTATKQQLRELASQREWVAEHGTTLDGYRQRYARLNASNPQQVAEIWEADVRYLNKLEATIGDQYPPRALHEELESGDVVRIRGRKFRVVADPTGAAEYAADGVLLWESLTLVLAAIDEHMERELSAQHDYRGSVREEIDEATHVAKRMLRESKEALDA